ncbi:hypothetical protein BH09BAC2_BH09BAC2_14940 [soil metagenome]
MKKILTLLIITFTFFTSCKKETDKEVPCAILDAKLIPATVLSSFDEKYPKQDVITWFNKDNKGYAAYFLNNGVKTLSVFSNEAGFIKEEIKTKHHHDENDEDDDEGCDCDID